MTSKSLPKFALAGFAFAAAAFAQQPGPSFKDLQLFGAPRVKAGGSLQADAGADLFANKLRNLGNTADALSYDAETNTWAIANLAAFKTAVGQLTAANLPALTGDVTSTAGSAATTLATVNSNVGQFGSATQAPVVTFDGKGRATAASSVTITPPWSSVTGKPTSAAGAGFANGAIIDAWGTKTVPAGLFFADATEASIQTMGAAANVAGGGRVIIPPGTIPITTGPLVIYNNVTYEGSDGTKLQGNGTFDCFSYAGAVLYADRRDHVGIRNLTIDNFRTGIKFGGTGLGGVTWMRLENLKITNCAEWGYWLENCQFGSVENVYVNACGVGYGMHRDSGAGAFNSGNYNACHLIGEITGPITRRGFVFQAAGGGTLNNVNVFGVGNSLSVSFYTSSAQTITNGNSAIPFPDLSKVAVDNGVQFGTTVGNITAGPTYFVLSKSAATGSGTITVSYRRGGTAITPSAGGSSTITTHGGTLLELENLTYCTFQGLDLEAGGTSGLLFQDCVGTSVQLGIMPTGGAACNDVSVRITSPYTNRFIANQTITWLDGDTSCDKIQWTGAKPVNSRSGQKGVGVTTDEVNGLTGLSLFGENAYDIQKSGADSSVAFNKLIKLKFGYQGATNTINFNQGQMLAINGGGGTWTLPTLTSTNIGIPLFISNPNASSATMATDGVQTFNNAAGVTTYTFLANTAHIFVGHNVGGTLYWAIY